MLVNTTFRHMDGKESIKKYVEEKMQRLDKYLDSEGEVHVVLENEKNDNHAELVINCHAIGPQIAVKNTHSDVFAAIDGAVEKGERQLSKRKEKLRDHSI